MRVMNCVLGLTLSVALCHSAEAVLVARYSFESDFSNGSGLTGPAATFVDTTGTTTGAAPGTPGGIVGNAVNFETETNEHINAAISFGTGNLLGADFTVSAWYNLNDPPATNSTSRYFVFEDDTNFQISYGLRGSLGGAAGFNDAQTFTSSASQNYVDAYTPGTWQHVAQVYTSDGTTTTIRTYIDGVDQGTITNTTANVIGSGINFGAARNSQTVRGFDGLIDEVAIWDEALSPGQIARVVGFGVQGVTIPDVVLEPVVGDADNNGVVNELDFYLISDNLSNSVTIGTNGDVDFDSLVTLSDFRLWKSVASPAALAAAGFGSVPEPATVVLLAGLFAITVAAYRRS